MPSYSTLADLKTYLNIATSTDDTLLQVMLDAATNRIDSRCGRVFQAASDEARYFDPSRDILNGELWLDDDLSYLTPTPAISPRIILSVSSRASLILGRTPMIRKTPSLLRADGRTWSARPSPRLPAVQTL